MLTGAGMSKGGISTFRDANGLWENHSIEEVANFDSFNKIHNWFWIFCAQKTIVSCFSQ